MKLKVRQATKKGYVEVEQYGVFDWAYPDSKYRRGRVQGKGGAISPTICTTNELYVFMDVAITKPRPQGKGWTWNPKEGKWFRIRKLTPRECFRLMDVDERYIDMLIVEYVDDKGRIQQVISNSQLYKLAGNSIVVSCMYYLFENLFYGDNNEEGGEGYQLSLF